jgi:hypothetical protein
LAGILRRATQPRKQLLAYLRRHRPRRRTIQ